MSRVVSDDWAVCRVRPVPGGDLEVADRDPDGVNIRAGRQQIRHPAHVLHPKAGLRVGSL